MSFLLHEEKTFEVIGPANEVSREPGPGFLESVYEEAFAYEIRKSNLKYLRKIDIDVHYKEPVLPNKFRADLIVKDKICRLRI
jgi:GxxExxY protein